MRPIGGQSKLIAIKRELSRHHNAPHYCLQLWGLTLHYITFLISILCLFHRVLLFLLDRKNSPPDFALFWASATEVMHSKLFPCSTNWSGGISIPCPGPLTCLADTENGECWSELRRLRLVGPQFGIWPESFIVFWSRGMPLALVVGATEQVGSLAVDKVPSTDLPLASFRMSNCSVPLRVSISTGLSAVPLAGDFTVVILRQFHSCLWPDRGNSCPLICKHRFPKYPSADCSCNHSSPRISSESWSVTNALTVNCRSAA